MHPKRAGHRRIPVAHAVATAAAVTTSTTATAATACCPPRHAACFSSFPAGTDIKASGGRRRRRRRRREDSQRPPSSSRMDEDASGRGRTGNPLSVKPSSPPPLLPVPRLLPLVHGRCNFTAASWKGNEIQGSRSRRNRGPFRLLRYAWQHHHRISRRTGTIPGMMKRSDHHLIHT